MTMLREASVVSEEYAGEGVVHLDEDLRIKRKCYPRGRLVFLYRMKFAEKDAVLKLMWTPVNRLPEPAVYQVLHGAGVDRIPKIYDQGILAKDPFGYRVDYMVVEDVGHPPDADIKGYASTSGESPCDRAVRLVAQVVKTLIEAKKAGVLHRDVSMGNIAVRGDRASLIDWGYAKLLAGDVNPAVIENLAATWEFDADDVLRNEDKHDPLTGTPMYMSIPVLVRAKTRGVVDDVESALYVLLDVVSRIQPPRPRAEGAEPPVAMDDTKGPSLAHVRACCFAVSDSYLSAFGVREASDRFHQVTDILYNYLFTRSGECISCLLARDPGYKREPDVDVLLESIYTVLPSLRDPPPHNQLRRSKRIKSKGKGKGKAV
ncbi:hypothetical protein IWQ56_003451 [Coemansia nantahalensis]|nr:hypothetical protein IWQ56_003451 [Coemansia nantahalensis]